MRRVTAAELDSAFTGPHDDAFWTLLHDYVQYCCASVPEYLRDDLVQDVQMAAFTAIGHTNIGQFSRWVNGVIFNLRGSAYRDLKYDNPEMPVSQLGEWSDDGDQITWTPDDIAKRSTESDSDRHDQAVSLSLDAIRSSLAKAKDIELFDMVRSGMTLGEAAAQTHQTYSAIQRRFSRLKNNLQRVSDLHTGKHTLPIETD